MRILVVSAHYPPNFVSGGTLQPQRLARGLHERGHDVSVYAGHLDSTRPPLSTWDECGDDGLAVRWIATTPFTEWRDRRSWDNPPAAEDFRRHLRDVRPDVVHIHGLQGLGHGVVHAAADAGIPVIVTMHDFWWLCGRQFLCTREFQPCPLVIDAGTCPCEVSVAWRQRRSRDLERALTRIDVVLAPSPTAARVLAANGVDPARLQVDENGMDDIDNVPLDERDHRDPPDATRFLYTGGSDRMKGVQHLVTAAESLCDVEGWQLTAYGIDRYLQESARTVAGLPVCVAAPYDPADTARVFGRHDVLVVPSVMRETHSLVTREALRHGLAVICTDTLGPEEVVHDDVNGIVVPAGDPTALAGAMRALATNRAQLTHMRAEALTIDTRALDDQLDWLEALYRDVSMCDRHSDSRPDRKRSRRRGSVLFVTGIEGAPFRYRVRLPAEALATLNVRSDVVHYRDARLARLAQRAAAVVLYRVPATTRVLEVLDRLGHAGIPRYFDVDDLIVDPNVTADIPAMRLLGPDDAALWLEGVRRYRTTLEACDVLIASTEPLARHVRELTGHPTHVFENGVGMVLGRRADVMRQRPRSPGPLRIGYFSGTDTHDLDWAAVEPAVVTVLDRNPEIELWLGGHLRVSDALAPFAARTRRLEFLPWLDLPAMLRDLDVNLAPLAPVAFNEAKSAIKWLEAALVETPTVASSTEPFRAAIESGATGLIADNTDAWVPAIQHLLDDAHLRGRMGALAHREALLRWAPRLQGRRYEAILAAPVDTRAPSQRTAPLVALDEPNGVVRLEPYRVETSLWRRVTDRLRFTAARARVGTDKLTDALRTDGVAATTRRAFRYSVRAVRSQARRGRS